MKQVIYLLSVTMDFIDFYSPLKRLFDYFRVDADSSFVFKIDHLTFYEDAFYFELLQLKDMNIKIDNNNVYFQCTTNHNLN